MTTTTTGLLYSYLAVALYDGLQRFKSGGNPLVSTVWPLAGLFSTLIGFVGPALQTLIAVDPAIVPTLQGVTAAVESFQASVDQLSTVLQQVVPAVTPAPAPSAQPAPSAFKPQPAPPAPKPQPQPNK